MVQREIPISIPIDKAWYRGESWSYPIFDGEQALGANSYLVGDNSQTRSNIIINNLKLINIGDPTTATGTAINFTGGGSGIEIKNCWLQPESVQAFGYTTGAHNATKLYFHDNHIGRAYRFVIYGETGYVLDDVRVYNNVMEGPGDTSTAGYHGDGLMIGNPAGGECADSGKATVTNIQFYNNYFYGDWTQGATAFFYSNGCTDGVTIYNNVFAYENTSCSGYCLSPGFVVIYNKDNNIRIYNNTFSNDAYPGWGKGSLSAIMINNTTGGGNADIKGNIFSGFGQDIVYDSCPTITIDHNLHNTAPGGNLINNSTSGSNWTCDNLSACQAHGMEINAPAMADPKFVSIPSGTIGSGDWHIQSSSPAIDAFPPAQAPANLFTGDYDNISRPQGSAWDIGAYEYVPGGDTTPPAAPTGLAVN